MFRKRLTLCKNLGRRERIFRAGLGVFFVLLGSTQVGLIGDVLLSGFLVVFGGMNILSSLSGYCPPYQLLGIDTRT